MIGVAIRFCFYRGGAVVPTELQHLAGFAELLEHFLHARGVGAVMLLDPFLDLLGRRDDHIDILPEREPEILRSARIEGICQRHSNGVAGNGDRQGAMQARETARNQLENSGRNFMMTEVDVIGRKRVGDCLIKAVLIDESAVDHRLCDRLPIQTGLVKNVVRLRRLKHVLLDEKLGDLFIVHEFLKLARVADRY